MRAGTDCGTSSLSNPGMETEFEVRRERLLFLQLALSDGARSGDHGIAALASPKERLFCNGHNTEGSHISSRCSCRKAQQTLAVKFSQSRVA